LVKLETSGQVTGTVVYKEGFGGQVSGMNGFVGGMGSSLSERY
jgi:hypothetical protein